MPREVDDYQITTERVSIVMDDLRPFLLLAPSYEPMEFNDGEPMEFNNGEPMEFNA